MALNDFKTCILPFSFQTCCLYIGFTVFSIDTKTIELHQQNYPSILPSLLCILGPFYYVICHCNDQVDQGC